MKYIYRVPKEVDDFISEVLVEYVALAKRPISKQKIFTLTVINEFYENKKAPREVAEILSQQS